SLAAVCPMMFLPSRPSTGLRREIAGRKIEQVQEYLQELIPCITSGRTSTIVTQLEVLSAVRQSDLYSD
ncbi:hypothetical protein, partial [Paenibacillus senegalensis]|uniref:hypothetical protein n=1 Tax=Paenibacillus senegalensis TaxID=1465766 RepID=UPI001B30E1C0